MTQDAATRWRPRIRQRNAIGRGFAALTIVSTLLGIAVLVALLVDVFGDGGAQVDGHFLTSYPSRFPEDAGLRSALLGTLWLLVLTGIIAFPLGVGAAIYLEEYAPNNWLTRFIQLNIANLAGVPSVVYGLLGLGLFVRWFALGRSLIAGAMTMALLILPLIIVASREAIRAVPDSQREASYALGATRWQTVFRTVLPAAGGGILTGNDFGAGAGDRRDCPLDHDWSALTYIAFDPTGPMDLFTVLPIQIFNWVSLPQEGFSELGGRRNRDSAHRPAARQLDRALCSIPIAAEVRLMEGRDNAGTTQTPKSKWTYRQVTPHLRTAPSSPMRSGHRELEVLVRHHDGALGHFPQHSAARGDGHHRPVRMRQKHLSALPEPHERPHFERSRRGPGHFRWRRHLRPQRRSGADAASHRHGVPEAEPVSKIHLRQHRLRAQGQRLPRLDGRSRRALAAAGGALGRGQGHSQEERSRAFRRAAAAAVHRAGAGGRAET